MRKPSTVHGTKQEPLISSKHKALGIILGATVLTWAIVSTIQMVEANNANQKKLKHDIEMQQILQERKTQEQIQQQKNELQEQIKTLEQRVEAKKANALASAAKAAESVAARVIPHAQASPVRVLGSCGDWMAAAGVTDTANATWLINKESGCNPGAVNKSSGACGIPQALPCSKLGTSDPVAQIRWMQNYVNQRYGGWAGAVAWHRSHNWY
jgi:hypothetical protein